MSICCTMIYVAHLHDALHLPGLIWIHKRLFANPEYVGLETHASAEELQNCIQRIVERLAPGNEIRSGGRIERSLWEHIHWSKYEHLTE